LRWWRPIAAYCARPGVLLAGLVLAVLAALTYANSFPCGLVLDNAVVIGQDPRLTVESWSSWQVAGDHFHSIFTHNYWWPAWESDLYRPITTLSYWLNYGVNHQCHAAMLGIQQAATALANGIIHGLNLLIDCGHRWWGLSLDHQLTDYPRPVSLPPQRDGLDPTGFHLVNLFLHWANALMVFVMARRVLASAWGGLWVAAVFAVHPLNTETVTNIVGRADLLATLSILLSLQLHLRACASCGWRRALYLAGHTVVTMLGMFCKESGVVVIGVMGLHDLCAAHPAAGEPLAVAVWRHVSRRAWVSYIFVLPSAITLFAVRYFVFNKSPVFAQIFADNPIVHSDFWHARMTAVGVLGAYLRLTFWPRTLSCDYSYNQVPVFTDGFHGFDLSCWISLAILAGMLALALWALVRRRRLFFFLALFAGTILPVANLLFPIGTIMGERETYLPLVGIVGAVALLARALVRRTGLSAAWRGTLLALAGSTIIVALGVRTFVRNVDWLDELHLWTSAVEACPNSYKVYQALATAIFQTDTQSLPVIDQAIAVGRRGLAVLDNPPLPPLDTPGLTMRNLAVYYMAKADALTRGRGPVLPPEVQAQVDACYQLAAEGLERAVIADHAVNDASRAYRVRHLGLPPEEIPDVGTTDTYKILGAIRMRMHQPERAIAAFAYMRRLNPFDPSGYDLGAGACIQNGELEQAAVLQIQAWIRGGPSPDTYPRLKAIYDRLAPNTVALNVGYDGRFGLNRDNPLVRRDVTLAWAGLIRAVRDFRQPDVAAVMRQQAIDNFGCSPEELDAPLQP
jgi:hypothetical protein